MIISDFYQTKIEASSYNVNIDATDTVITVSLIDFNGAAVTGKQVVLTCDKGYFNKNGSTAISGTTTKSITATTDSNGQITATWTASEWGLATFSTNTVNSQIKVKGWKAYRDDAVYKIYYNDEYVYFQFSYSGSSGEANITTSWMEFGATPFYDEFIRPSANVTFFLSYNTMGNVRPSSGKFRVRTISGTQAVPYGMWGETVWKRR